MENNRTGAPSAEGRVNTERIYALLCGLKVSVDRLALQVKQLRKEREGERGE